MISIPSHRRSARKPGCPFPTEVISRVFKICDRCGVFSLGAKSQVSSRASCSGANKFQCVKVNFDRESN